MIFINLDMEKYGIKGFATEHIGGNIKFFPEDFIVEEIGVNGRIYTAGYNFIEAITDMLPKTKKEHVHCTLVKRNYTTERAISQLSHALRVSRTRIGFAGTKDKKAVTSQRISVWNVDLQKIKDVKLKDMLLKNFSYEDQRINLGDLSGNRFTITIRDIKDTKTLMEKMFNFSSKLHNGIPNFFGPQRFGVQRTVNHLIGKQLLLGNFEGAAMIFLTSPGDENPEAKSAREFAAKHWGEWGEILKIWPRTLGLEAAVINYLLKYPNDYANAIRKLPKNIRRMFIHAFQSLLFNKTLSFLMENKIKVPKQLPLIGYETTHHGDISDIIGTLLKEEQVMPEDFKIKRMPEISEPGLLRDSFVFPKDFKVIKVKGAIVTIQFKLDKGSYATVVLYALLGKYVE
jgi:tRNA pseudouridine13 synthase